MATGDAWTIDQEAPDVLKPWAQFDSDAILDIPFDWSEWLADKGTTYSSHSVITHASLECTQSSQASGVIKVRIKKATAATLVAGTKYEVTCRIVAADGQQEDQTVYLRATSK